MLETVKINLLLPILGRAGTALATAAVVHYAVDPDIANGIGTAVVTVGGLLFDLAVSQLRKKSIIKGGAYGRPL